MAVMFNSDDDCVVRGIENLLQWGPEPTQAILVAELRKYDNSLAQLFANLLDPQGTGTGFCADFQLVLSRRKRGRFRDWQRQVEIIDEYEDALKKFGNARGAIKQAESHVAREYKMTNAAVRGVIRRLTKKAPK